MRPRTISDELQITEAHKIITPHQDEKMYEEGRMRGLETSEMTCVYDKENIQFNKPRKGRPPVKMPKKEVEEFSSEVQNDHGKCSLERQPLKSLDQKKETCPFEQQYHAPSASRLTTTFHEF